MNVDALRKTGELQGQHWTAVRWLEEHWSTKRRQIAALCREVEASVAGGGLDRYALLHRAVVAREPLLADHRVLGALRETLNAVDRFRRKLQ